jgi:hypothetical protein
MSSSGAALSGFREPYLASQDITVKDATANPETVYVKLRGMVRFVNQDQIDYKVRLWTRGKREHADVDLLLPALKDFTLIVDPGTTINGECEYELLETGLQSVDCEDNEKSAAPVAEALHMNMADTSTMSFSSSVHADSSHGGGGTIKIGG